MSAPAASAAARESRMFSPIGDLRSDRLGHRVLGIGLGLRRPELL
jgi:hypothetical protein